MGNPHIQRYMIYDKGSKAEGKRQSFEKNGPGSTLYPHRKKKKRERKIDPHLTSNTKINFSNVGLNVSGKIKFPEDNLLKEYLYDFGVGKDFFNVIFILSSHKRTFHYF